MDLDYADDKEILKMLCGYGVTKVTAEFDGAGDSGQIDPAQLEAICGDSDHVRGLPVPDEVIAAYEEIELENLTDAERKKDCYANVGELIDSWIDSLVERTNMDWYNNDGGWGEVVIVPGTGSINVDMNVRVTESVHSDHDYSLPPEAIDWTEPANG